MMLGMTAVTALRVSFSLLVIEDDEGEPPASPSLSTMGDGTEEPLCDA